MVKEGEMMDLKERFEQAVDDAKFTLSEVQGFQVKPRLALIAGVAIGYGLSLKEQMEAKKDICIRKEAAHD